MALMGYNRKLAWVVAAALLWSLLAISVATGGFHWRLGPPPGAIELRGRVAAVKEADGVLELHLAVRPGDRYELPADLPPDLSVQYQVMEELPARPRLDLKRRQPRGRGGRRGFGELDTERYLLRFTPELIRVIPKGHKPLFAPPLPPEVNGQPSRDGRQPPPPYRPDS